MRPEPKELKELSLAITSPDASATGGCCSHPGIESIVPKREVFNPHYPLHRGRISSGGGPRTSLI